MSSHSEETKGLRSEFERLLARGLDQATVLQTLSMHTGVPTALAAADVARQSRIAGDDVEIDDFPLYSQTKEGTWVSAWIFVRNDAE